MKTLGWVTGNSGDDNANYTPGAEANGATSNMAEMEERGGEERKNLLWTPRVEWWKR